MSGEQSALFPRGKPCKEGVFCAAAISKLSCSAKSALRCVCEELRCGAVQRGCDKAGRC